MASSSEDELMLVPKKNFHDEEAEKATSDMNVPGMSTNCKSKSLGSSPIPFERSRRSPSSSQVTQRNRRSPSSSPVTQSNRRSPSSSPVTQSNRRSPSSSPVTQSNRRSPSSSPVTQSNRRSPSSSPVTQSNRRSPSSSPATQRNRRSPISSPVTQSNRRSPISSPISSPSQKNRQSPKSCLNSSPDSSPVKKYKKSKISQKDRNSTSEESEQEEGVLNSRAKMRKKIMSKPLDDSETEERTQIQKNHETSDEGVDDVLPAIDGRNSGNKTSSDSEIDTAVHDKKGRRRGKASTSRKSKVSAMDEIRSESNRMLRESAINIPYHRPKTRTLEEFLNRKKGAPEVVSDIKMNLNKVQIEESEKLLEMREKMTFDFHNEEEDEEKMDEGNDASDEEYDPTKELTALNDEKEPKEAAEDIGNKIDGSGILSGAGNSGESSNSNSDEDKPKDVDAMETSNNTVANESKEKMEVEREEQSSNDVNMEEDDIEKELKELESKLEEEETNNKKSETNVLPNDDEKDSEKENQQSESMHLLLESESLAVEGDSDDVVNSSVNDVNNTSLSNAKTPLLSKRLAALGAKKLSKTLEEKPKLGAGIGQTLEFDLEDEGAESKDGLDFVPQENKKDLMERFVKHVNAKSKKKAEDLEHDVDLTIVSKETDESGHENLKMEKIKYHSKALPFQASQISSERPGLKHIALKKTLKEKIAEQKRKERELREELMKQEETEEGFADVEDEEEVEEDIEDEELSEEEEGVEDEEEENVEEESGGEEEEEEEDEDNIEEAFRNLDKNKRRVKNAFLDDEAEDDDDGMDKLALEESDEDLDHENDGIKVQSPLPTLTQLSNMNPRLTPFDQRTQNQESVIENPDPDKSPNARKKLGFDGLLNETDENMADMDDLVGLCSGQFVSQHASNTSQATPDTVVMTASLSGTAGFSLPGSQKHYEESQDTVILSQAKPESQGFALEELETEELAPGFMEEKVGFLADDKAKSEFEPKEESTQKLQRKRILLPADSDEEEEEDKKKKPFTNFVSEDEEDQDNQENVEYDSEENEVEKPKFTGFKGKKGLRKEFVDNEAELSGSDPESGDEDERGLNRMELEEGDLDEFDEEDVRDEVGKIHQRQLLDADKREIRLFKEAFLEDGDLHSEQNRNRTFKWKGIDQSDELDKRLSDDEADHLLDEAEEKRRLERLEREKWLQESDISKTGQDQEEGEEDSQFFNMASKAMKQIEKKEILRQSSKEESQKIKKVFQSPTHKVPLQSKSFNARGSFLSRNTATLNKLAELTKSKDESRAGTGAKNTKNFVFATLSPKKGSMEDESSQDMNTKKRKAKSVTIEKAKKPKIDRSIDENSMDTIFGKFK